MMKNFSMAVFLLVSATSAQAQIQTSAGVQYLMNTPRDMSGDFSDLSHTYFLADSLSAFDVDKAEAPSTGNVIDCLLARLSI